MDVVLLRLDAPLMSFGGVVVDQHNRTDVFPSRAMLAGLVANALGFGRLEERRLAALQDRIRHAARCDRKGSSLIDYQTVDFDPKGAMAGGLGWTTRGRIEERKGGDASEGTHIRYRHYVADGIVTVALTLEPAEDDPSVGAMSAALRSPARPLFLGRKCCMPSGPLWLGELRAESLREALERTPRAVPVGSRGERRSDEGPLPAIWPQAEGHEGARTRLWPRVEDRDRENDIHVGRRLYVVGWLDAPESVRPGAEGS